MNQIKNVSRLINKNNIIGQLYQKRFSAVEAGELKRGMWIELKNKALFIEKVTHQKVAMRGGYIIADIKNVVDGSKSTVKFRSAEDVELLDLSKEEYNFKGKQGKSWIFKRSNQDDDDGDDEEVGEDEDEEDENTVVCSNPLQLEGYAPYLSMLGETAEYQFRNYKNNVIDFVGPTQIDLTVTGIDDLQNNVVLHFENGRTCKGPHYLKPGDRVQIRIPDEVFIKRIEE